MEFADIEKLAKTNDTPPSNLVDLYAYELLKVCYDTFRQNKDLEQSKSFKQAIIKAWEKENIFNSFLKILGNNVKYPYQYSDTGYITGELHALKICKDGKYSAEIKSGNSIYVVSIDNII